MRASTPSPEKRPIEVRKMGFSFDDLPRHWLYNSAFATHVANGLHLVFPAGERFFIRSVKHYLDRIEDPDLRQRIRGFFGQEGSHGHEHEAAFAAIESQGYEIRAFLRWYETWAYRRLEPRLPPNLRLSMTAALEHFTAVMAERGLSTNLLDGAHPTMASLLKWHAAEEIEHRSVAFDVLRQVDPRYGVRVAGLGLALAALMFFWRSGTAMLLAQEPEHARKSFRKERRTARARGQNLKFIPRAIFGYLRPGFHPAQRPIDRLADDYLASIGRAKA